MMSDHFDRPVDRETHSCRNGLMLGLWDIENGEYSPHPLAYVNTSWLSPAATEGYRDALDDSDDYPEPFDPERTLVP
jgi:hypothetical protein